MVYSEQSLIRKDSAEVAVPVEMGLKRGAPQDEGMAKTMEEEGEGQVGRERRKQKRRANGIR